MSENRLDEKKPSKLHDIKETASDAVKIMRQIGTPGVFQSFSKIKETATIANEIIQVLKSPEVVKNIENFSLISQNMNEASTKMQNTMQQLKETGIIDQSTELVVELKVTVASSTKSGTIHNVKETIDEASSLYKTTIA